jgi:hypothetical protein
MKPRLFKTHAAFIEFTRANPGRVFSVGVMHDDACSPSGCVCAPWYEVREATPEALLEGQRAQAAWVRSKTN